jgi:hypothetical protein
LIKASPTVVETPLDSLMAHIISWDIILVVAVVGRAVRLPVKVLASDLDLELKAKSPYEWE